jgi:hypothetical protein
MSVSPKASDWPVYVSAHSYGNIVVMIPVLKIVNNAVYFYGEIGL